MSASSAQAVSSRPASSELKRGVRALGLMLFGVLLALSAAAFSNVFRVSDLALPIVVAGLGSCATLTAIDRLFFVSCPVVVPLVGSVMVGLLVTALVVDHSLDVGLVLRGAQNGWADILSSGLPVAAKPEYLVVPALITWCAGVVGAAILLRTKACFWPLAPPVAVVAVATLLGLDAVDWPAWARVTWLMLAGALVLQRSDLALASGYSRSRASAGVGRGAVLVGAAVGLTLLVGATTALVPRGDPTQLRNGWTTSSLIDASLSPLGLVTRAALEASTPQGQRPVLTVQTDVGVVNPRLVVAVLDTFDGATWSTSGVFRAAGGALPGSRPGRLAEQQRVRQNIELLDGLGPWLPALENPIGLRAPLSLEPQVDRSSGMLARAAKAGSGGSYVVTSEVPTVPIERLIGGGAPGAVLAGDPAVSRPAEVSPELVELAAGISGPGPNPFAQLSRLIGFFTNVPVFYGVPAGFRYDPTQGRGTSLGALEAFILKDRVGSTEQFAAAFVLMARLMNFPSRVVVGYAPGVTIKPNVETAILASSLRAWPAVFIRDAGWVSFPIDVGESGGVALADPVAQQNVTELVTSPQAEPGKAEVPPVLEPADRGRTPWWMSAVFAAIFLLVFGAVVVLGLAVARRIHRLVRRRTPDPTRRVELAWEETVGLAMRLDLGPVFSFSSGELASVLGARFGTTAGQDAAKLGDLLDHAVHSTETTTATDGERAWDLEGRVRGACLEAVPWRRRAVLDIVPRSAAPVD